MCKSFCLVVVELMIQRPVCASSAHCSPSSPDIDWRERLYVLQDQSLCLNWCNMITNACKWLVFSFLILIKTFFKWQHERPVCVGGRAACWRMCSVLWLFLSVLLRYFHKQPSAPLSEQRTLTVAVRPLVSFCSQFGYLTCFKIHEHNICLIKESVWAF